VHVPRDERGGCGHVVVAEARPRALLRQRRVRLPRPARRAPRAAGDDVGMAHMEHRGLGRTGITVSRLGLGLAAIGRPGYIPLGRARDLRGERSADALYALCAEVLDAACAAGVRYVDVARSYGRAEEFLARWLVERGVPDDALSVGSKWGYRYTAGWTVDAPVHEQKELSPPRFTQQVAESRALLGRRLDLYEIHSATAESGVLTDATLLRLLVERKQAG